MKTEWNQITADELIDESGADKVRITESSTGKTTKQVRTMKTGTGRTKSGTKDRKQVRVTKSGADDRKQVRVKKSGADTDSGTDEKIAKTVTERRGAKWTKELTETGGNISRKDNARFIRCALVSWDLPPIDISDPEQVKNRITEYFHFCAENERKPQIVGLANWLGVDRRTLTEWQNGEYRRETHYPIIKKAVAMIEEMWADYMQAGKINPATGIFIAKNWYGYKDVADVVVTPNNPLQNLDETDAKKRLLESVPIIDDEE